MASQDLKHRATERDEPNAADSNAASDVGSRKGKRKGVAKRGFRSLAIAVAFPVALTVLVIYLFGSSTRFRNIEKPFYLPPLWALHLSFLTSALLSGLSSWLVWADGGFHRSPVALSLYVAQLVLSLGWYPIVFARVGLVLWVALFVALVGGWRTFKSLNPIAGDLYLPCLVAALIPAAVNYRLLYSQ
ncbi:translocator protein [Dorcoceras hygrometricum]|uniref:Translocator protein n=1 Tax=Dorcoceras hygrometricum TaxID=472368 RepID=A0A2Z7BXK4_9LAMI|nr:translocator protein [Dorcoceras hygrometricum]